ncbi:MAG: hypothetical protein AB8F95_19810 [Bacteroidia bacterium]
MSPATISAGKFGFYWLLLIVMVSSCDKKLNLEPADNIEPISLAATQDGSITTLSWTAIDHPGFSGYWLVRVDEDDFLIQDSIQFRDLNVLFISKEVDQTTFIDSLPNLSDGGKYKLFAQVYDRFIPSNVIDGREDICLIEGRLFGGKIVGADGLVYFIYQKVLGGTFFLQRYNVDTKTTEQSVSLGEQLSGRYIMEYGDFGGGGDELMLYVNSTLAFYDPQTLHPNHIAEKPAAELESGVRLPNKQAVFLYGRASVLRTYNRADSAWGPYLQLSKGGTSRYNFIAPIPGESAINIVAQPYTRYRLSYNSEGVFSEERVVQTPSLKGIFTSLMMDPQGEYMMPSRFGEIYNTGDLEKVAVMESDSSRGGNRVWAFNADGSMLAQISVDFPAKLYVYDRDQFKLLKVYPAPQNLGAMGSFTMDNKSYWAFQKFAESPKIVITPFL